MITFEEFERVACLVESTTPIKRHMEDYDFWRSFSVRDAQITWWKNAISVKIRDMHVRLTGDVYVNIDGFWPNAAKTNLVFSSDSTHVVIPLEYYEQG
jgi:hypothetical protein